MFNQSSQTKPLDVAMQAMIVKCDLFFHYCDAKEISLYCFRDTRHHGKHGKIHMNSIYIAGITCVS